MQRAGGRPRRRRLGGAGGQRASSALLAACLLLLLQLGCTDPPLTDEQPREHQGEQPAAAAASTRGLGVPAALRRQLLLTGEQAEEQEQEQQRREERRGRDDAAAAEKEEQPGGSERQPTSSDNDEWRMPAHLRTQPAPCATSLFELAQSDPELQTLVAAQRLTRLNFFAPFGPDSKRDYTLLAPTDEAWNATFERATPEELRALQDGFPALLLYHQILSDGYSASALASRFSVPTALGPSVNEELPVDMDKNTDPASNRSYFVASGRAPNNYGLVLREYEACGAHMLVIDEVMQPLGQIEQLPRLQTERPIDNSTWERLLAVIEGSEAPPEDNEDSSSGSDDSAGSSSGVDDGSGGGGASDGNSPAAGTAGGPPPFESDPTFRVVEAAPAPPGPPDCTSLAARGELMFTQNGTLITTGCGAAAGAVVRNGTVQTAVSDASQTVSATSQPPEDSPPPSAAVAAAAHAFWPVALASAACLLLLA